MLTITEDTSSGVHDTLIAACDRYRYAELGVEGALAGSSVHRCCEDNLAEALTALGMYSFSAPVSLLSPYPFQEDFVVCGLLGSGRPAESLRK